MKHANKLLVALCVALVACLAVPALLPAGPDAPFTARAAAKLSKTKATLYNGKTLKLKLTGVKKAVKWSSSDTSVAKVDQKGVVTAKKAGKATITAQADGRKYTCLITVKPSLSAKPTSLTMDVGKTKKITLTNKVNSGLSLESYNPNIVRCTFGKIKNGKCTLTVKASGAGAQTLVVKSKKTGDTVKIKVTVRNPKGHAPTAKPTAKPTARPTAKPTARPTAKPTARPTAKPTARPTAKPTARPTAKPTARPTAKPTAVPPIVDKTSVTVAAGKSATVHVTWPYSGVPYMWFDNSNVVNCTFGDWANGGWPLYIKGVGEGTAKVWFTREDVSTGTPVVTIDVTVK